MPIWPTRNPKAPLVSDGGTKATYSLGRYVVTVDFAAEHDDAVTYSTDRPSSTDPRRTLPNMEISDGVLSIPLSDFIEEILESSEPVDVARALFQNDEVRRHVLDALAERWSSDSFNEADRRSFLARIQAAVHSAAVDRLAGRIAEMEWSRAHQFYHHQHTARVNDWLMQHGLELRIPYEPEDPAFVIGGKAWTEARADWRKLVLASFPEPAKQKDTD